MSLTDEQKAAIAEARNFYDSKIAEQEVLYQSKMRATFDPAERETFLERIEAGVVYVNRREGATTGAWPGIQTFPGWKSSGLSGKGGLGPHYLTQFMREQSRTVMTA